MLPARGPIAHDLVRFAGAHYRASMPDWSRRSADADWAVVRRVPAESDGRIGVGLRGRQRDERAALAIHPDDILELVVPESLRGTVLPSHAHPDVASAYNFLAGSDESPLHEFTWGPTGAVGFELATGLCSTRPTSDLDLIVRAPAPISPAHATSLVQAFATLPCRIDCLLETDVGAVALAEWANSAGDDVLLRTTAGPVLTTAPWSTSREPVGRS